MTPSLDEALAAMRAEPTPGAPGATRARVLRTLGRRNRVRRGLLSAAIVVGIVLVGGPAFAWLSGDLGAVLELLADPEQDVSPAPAAISPMRATPPAPIREVAPPEPEEPEAALEPTTEPAAHPVPSTLSGRARGITRRLRRVAEAAPAPVPVARDGLHVRYREAHAAHFHGGDPAVALAAWDRYLAESPEGRFALEARYNRAICLVRLGQTPAALEALEPFAVGAEGDYRRADATRLVEALRQR